MTEGTTRTDAIRDRLHASFVNWPEEAQDGIERYDELSRALEFELSQALADKAAAVSRAETLVQYAQHHSGCDKAKQMPTETGVTYYWPVDYINWQVQQKCTCGLSAALSPAEKDRHEEYRQLRCR